MRTRKREKRAPMDTDSEDSWTPGSGHIQQRGAHAALRLSFPLAILQKEKEKGEKRMLTIPGPTQTRYFHFHKHQEWNTNTHHPKDSMMSAPHHCRQRRSERSHHPSLLSNLSVSQGEMGRDRETPVRATQCWHSHHINRRTRSTKSHPTVAMLSVFARSRGRRVHASLHPSLLHSGRRMMSKE